jgi:hypothetical protein
VQNLEAGRGSSVQTLLRILKALNYLEGIEILAPQPTVNPLALLKTKTPPQRARHRRLARPRDKESVDAASHKETSGPG